MDTAFNDCLFMWDSAFILAFGRYGRRAFDFQRTLDNLYAKQHADGFICREIGTLDGLDRFERFDPASTGPNAVSWSEWEHYMSTGDRERLSRVFPSSLLTISGYEPTVLGPTGCTGRQGWPPAWITYRGSPKRR